MNQEICELVKSAQGKPKINVHGYLLVKDKNNGNRYYWCCEFRKKYNCNGRAITDLENENHILVSFKEHSHSPEANRIEVVKTLNIIKESASHTHDRPVQLIQDAVVNMHQSSHSYMPNKQALGKQISRIRNKNLPPQPQELEDIEVPIELSRTINGESFLAKEVEFGEEKMMIFCTIPNLQYLQDAEYWLMDGTFKTVPLLFQQMYTIHAPVGGENARVLPLVYVLMTGRSKECYNQLFQELFRLGEAASVTLNPSFIITDFEQAAIHAAQDEFTSCLHKGCFFHFCQNLWRKIQASGLAIEYGSDEEFSIKLRYLTALAFLPSSDIPNAFDQIKPLMPSSAEAGYPRTQNLVEGWHQRWLTLLGKQHVGVYTIIKEMRNEQHQTELQIEDILCGASVPHKRKHIIDREKRILTVFNNRNNYTIVEYLRGIAHNISL
ncbi:unnamed protein product [Rhizophagus irregularis]|nr:unnamed protein product [Rhizophagus irregularis]